MLDRLLRVDALAEEEDTYSPVYIKLDYDSTQKL